eukprot:gene30130-biopygen15988
MSDHLIAAEQIGQLRAQLEQTSIANSALTEQFMAKVAAKDAEVADLVQRLAVSSAATEAALANGDPTERQELLNSHYFLGKDLANSRKALSDLQAAFTGAAAIAKAAMDALTTELGAKETALEATQANLPQTQAELAPVLAENARLTKVVAQLTRENVAYAYADGLLLECDPENIVDAMQQQQVHYLKTNWRSQPEKPAWFPKLENILRMAAEFEECEDQVSALRLLNFRYSKTGRDGRVTEELHFATQEDKEHFESFLPLYISNMHFSAYFTHSKIPSDVCNSSLILKTEANTALRCMMDFTTEVNRLCKATIDLMDNKQCCDSTVDNLDHFSLSYWNAETRDQATAPEHALYTRELIPLRLLSNYEVQLATKRGIRILLSSRLHVLTAFVCCKGQVKVNGIQFYFRPGFMPDLDPTKKDNLPDWVALAGYIIAREIGQDSTGRVVPLDPTNFGADLASWKEIQNRLDISSYGQNVTRDWTCS